MQQQLKPRTIILLTIPPLLWAGNVVVGRMINQMIPPITLNFFRWLIAFFILLPFSYQIFRRGSGIWQQGMRLSLLGLLGIGLYNTLQYIALQSSSPINVTLVGSSIPVWMMIVGAIFFSVRIRREQMIGASLSIAGVLIVLSHGELQQLLGLRLVFGDLLMICASIVWAFYSWLLLKTKEPARIRHQWAPFLSAQLAYGVLWSGLFSIGEWTGRDLHIQWNLNLVLAIAYVAIGPAVLAYKCWGDGVQQAGPNIAGFFTNLTPLFTAVLAGALLGEIPQLHHLIAFLFIVSGIAISSYQRRQPDSTSP
ncbi:DMT family transporter [Undibacterium cyanobacteriorum]|uniref:DMT family transporter n=1 Tax=Undibacterium cyanobacteriorum TaxID=3073561 RepID=A0ABY9RMS3_9BURK|nr:DMT family transporter [Undibacterium sp. 20NA77.5]WMW81580.1 DMT family transporter [Undibacterium sp. 20NA77.5]